MGYVIPRRKLGLLEFRKFNGGLSTRPAPQEVEDGQCVDCLNVMWDGETLRSRPGMALDSADLAGSNPIVGMHRAYKADGRKWTFVACNDQVYFSDDDGAYTSMGLLGELGATGYRADTTYPVTFMQWGDKTYFCNHFNEVKRFDGVDQAGAAIITSISPIYPPTTAPTVKPYAKLEFPCECLAYVNGAVSASATITVDGVQSWDFIRVGQHFDIYKTSAYEAQDVIVQSVDSSASTITFTTTVTVSDDAELHHGWLGAGGGSRTRVTNPKWTGTGAMKFTFDGTVGASVTHTIGATDPWDLSDSNAIGWVVWCDSSIALAPGLRLQFGEATSDQQHYQVTFDKADIFRIYLWDISGVAPGDKDGVQSLALVDAYGGGAFSVYVDQIYDAGGLPIESNVQHYYTYRDSSKLAGVHGDDMRESSPSPISESVFLNDVDFERGIMRHAMVYLTIPRSTQPSVDKIRIYRVGGSTRVAKFVAEIANPASGNATYVDSIPDWELGADMVEGAAAPPYARHMVRHHDRAIMADFFDEGDMNTAIGGAAVQTNTARTCMTAPTVYGPSKGVRIYVAANTGTAPLTAYLEKYDSTVSPAVWNVQRSKTIAAMSLMASTWNTFFWDTGTGDNCVDAASSTWRIRVQAGAGTAAFVGTSDDTNISYIHLIDYPNRLLVSNFNAPEVYNGAAGRYSATASGEEGGYIDLPEGHKITAIKPFGDDLVVFTPYRTYLLTGYDMDTYELHLVSATHGCDALYSLAQSAEELFWLGNRHVWGMSGGRVYEVSRPPDNPLEAIMARVTRGDVTDILDDIPAAYLDLAAAVYYPKWQAYLLGYAETGQTVNNKTLVFWLRNRTWGIFDWAPSRWLLKDAPGDSGTLMLGANTGRIYNCDTTNADAGANISCVYETKHHSCPQAGGDAEWRWRGLEVQYSGCAASQTLTCTPQVDDSAGTAVAFDLEGSGYCKQASGLDWTTQGRHVGMRLTWAAGEEVTIHWLGARFARRR